MSIEKKEELQREAEMAHAKMGYKSTICASVGSGKSKIAINRILSHFSRNDRIAKVLFTGAREIYLSTFKEELNKWGYGDWIDDVTFCCVASLKKHSTTDWDLIIVDESHLDVERILEFISIYKKKACEILLLTGTPIKETNPIGREIYNICPISYLKGIDTSIENELINDYHITIIMHELSDEQYVKYGNAWQSEKQKYGWLYKCYLNCNKTRKKFPFELMNLKRFFKNLRSKEDIAEKLLEHIKGKVLIYAGSIDQAQMMQRYCYHSDLSKDERAANLKRFINGEIDALVNVAGIRESVNIPGLKYGVIMAPDASQNAFEQTVGRFSRLVIGDVAQVFVLCAKGTIEEVWINKAIKHLDSTKISKLNIEQIENIYK